jgi:Rod binding domain-containing protein
MDAPPAIVAAPNPVAAPVPRPSRAASDPARTARDFEAVFMGQITKIMMETVDTGEQFSGGHGEEMFRGVLAEEMGKAIAQRGGIGLAPVVLDQIIRLQGETGDAR